MGEVSESLLKRLTERRREDDEDNIPFSDDAAHDALLRAASNAFKNGEKLRLHSQHLTQVFNQNMAKLSEEIGNADSDLARLSDIIEQIGAI